MTLWGSLAFLVAFVGVIIGWGVTGWAMFWVANRYFPPKEKPPTQRLRIMEEEP